MKNYLLLALIFFQTASVAQLSQTILSPSIYYTHGAYSNQNSSNSIALYTTLKTNNDIYFIAGYDNLNINNPDWTYLQQMFAAGTIFAIESFYIKANYAHIKGDFDYKPFFYRYSDFSNLYNADLFYYFDGNYLGAGYTHLNQIGLKTQRVNQMTIRLERIFLYDFFVSVKPSVSLLSDKGELFSVALKVHYLISPQWLAKAGGFVGKRAYYFDSDLLTIFNQDDTQKFQAFAQIEYVLNSTLRLIGNYQYSKFAAYSINYFVIGIRTNFNL
jgi:hypothetical protein